MIQVQNFTSDPSEWSICGGCAADLPKTFGTFDGAWVRVGATLVSIVCKQCETRMTRTQKAAAT